jgi:hypothetical protein
LPEAELTSRHNSSPGMRTTTVARQLAIFFPNNMFAIFNKFGAVVFSLALSLFRSCAEIYIYLRGNGAFHPDVS